MLAAITVPHLNCNPVKLIPVNITINPQLIKQRFSYRFRPKSVTVQRFPAFDHRYLDSGIFIALSSNNSNRLTGGGHEEKKRGRNGDL